METKLFEVRDRATLIAVMATRLSPTCEKDRYLLSRSGYGLTHDEQSEYFLVGKIDGGVGKFCCDPYEFRCSTMHTAFRHIKEHWDDLPSGSVICCEFIRGERAEPKVSESQRAYSQ